MYNIDFSAADPDLYPRVLQSSNPVLPVGRSSAPIANADHANEVESLVPGSDNLAVDQIVPFLIEIQVPNNAPAGDSITLVAEWDTVTTNGSTFGYDDGEGVIAAFVDDADPSAVNDTDATVSSFFTTLGTNSFQGTITVDNLDPGEKVVVEIWVVLQETLPASLNGNVQARMISASAVSDPSINVGNQTVPLKSTDVECFLTGTYILTENGEVPVETLKIGDKVQTAEGTLEAIKWIGRQTTASRRVRNPLRGLPIQVKAGALGNNLPKRDLFVSPDHALLVDGLLINAGALVNDVSILKTEPTEAFTYYHIELDKHALLVAEGSAAESYLPQKEDRYLYDNGAEYEELYPNQCNMILWPLDYPRVSSYTTVPRYVRKNLMAIANQLEGVKALQLA